MLCTLLWSPLRDVAFDFFRLFRLFFIVTIVIFKVNFSFPRGVSSSYTRKMSNLHSTEQNSTFNQRLCHAVVAMGWDESPTLVAREFNLRWRGKAITVNAVRKWMLGENVPTLEKLLVLADLLGVSADWLRWGVVEKLSVDEVHALYVKQISPKSSSIKSLTQDLRLLTDNHFKLVQALVSAMLVEQKQKEKVTAGDGE